MRLRYLSYLTFGIVCLVPTIAAQQRAGRPYANILLKKNQPPIYITYDHAGERIRMGTEKEQVLWFRLHNNTKWAISVYKDMFWQRYGVPPKYQKVRLSGGSVMGLADGSTEQVLYDLETLDGRPVHEPFHNSLVGGSWLLSGRSLLFAVPTEEFQKDRRISVSYDFEWAYQWKNGRQTYWDNFSTKDVYFFGRDVPQNTQGPAQSSK